jgi:hypothetical protein
MCGCFSWCSDGGGTRDRLVSGTRRRATGFPELCIFAWRGHLDARVGFLMVDRARLCREDIQGP